MNNQLISVLLIGAMMAIYFVQANPTGLTNELDDEHESGADGGLQGLSIGSLWGTGDVLEDGVANLVDPRSATCGKAKDRAACRVCCEQTGKASKFSHQPALKISWAVCTCYQRVTPVA